MSPQLIVGACLGACIAWVVFVARCGAERDRHDARAQQWQDAVDDALDVLSEDDPIPYLPVSDADTTPIWPVVDELEQHRARRGAR